MEIAPEEPDNGRTTRKPPSPQTTYRDEPPRYTYSRPPVYNPPQIAYADATQTGYSKQFENWPSNVSLPEVERLMETAILQGSRLSLEVAKRREKVGNIWRAWTWSQPPENATKALEGIMDCIDNNPGSFIRLVGYNPQTQTRTLEELIIRP